MRGGEEGVTSQSSWALGLMSDLRAVHMSNSCKRAEDRESRHRMNRGLSYIGVRCSDILILNSIVHCIAYIYMY